MLDLLTKLVKMIMRSLKRIIKLRRLGKRILRSGSSTIVTHGRVQKVSFSCCCWSGKARVLKQVFLKLKLQWRKETGRWRRSNGGYSYDLRSYNLNFDDGSFQDHVLRNSFQ